MKVSVIIPVYKVEQYLPDCLNSLLAQTYRDWEAILVDDGSPDKSGAICDEYAAKDPRFHVIHKENGGVSSARNAALKVVRGNYITFLDSDDMLTSDALEGCIKVMSEDEVDVVYFQCQTIKPSGTELSQSPNIIERIIDNVEFCKLFMTGKLTPGVWGKIYRKEILNGQEFEENLSMGEDAMFLFLALYNTPSRVYLANNRYYLYRLLPTSISRARRNIMYKRTLDYINYIATRYNEISSKSGGRYDLILANSLVGMTLNNREGCFVHVKNESLVLLKRFSPYINIYNPSRYNCCQRIIKYGKFYGTIELTLSQFLKYANKLIKLFIRFNRRLNNNYLCK